MTTETLEALQKLKLLAQQNLEEVQGRLRALQRKTLVRCDSNNFGSGCGQALEIGELEYIQTHRYIPPHGCSGGDYWVPEEGRFLCPKCNHTNRLYNKPDITALKSLFKSVQDQHRR